MEPVSSACTSATDALAFQYQKEWNDACSGRWHILSFLNLNSLSILSCAVKASQRLRTFSGSSALFLCTCIIASPDSLSLPMLDRSQVFSRLNAENDLSHEQVVTGSVR
ncbi:putative protein YqjF [Dissostichus eleginoides]|uniref:Uncharacterized protein n=1 Tax=Dissostichus eleginoides TaxID=100907 RepID=A0AAD9CCE2_DISEL|nr:putative protein YqjF [Dissostichus eleginoides]